MPRRNNTPPHHPLRLRLDCSEKRRYATEREARETADYQMLLNLDLELAVYKCELCGGWHLTRQTDNRHNND